MSLELIIPDWPAPANVKAVSTTRQGGSSTGAYASLNLASHVGDDPAQVGNNRELLRQQAGLPAEPAWLEQVHGARLVHASEKDLCADASWSSNPAEVCAVMTADCLPLLLCNRSGSRVAAAHAGWRGLHAGVIESALAGFDQGDEILAWLGPAIGPQAFEVGEEVLQAFTAKMPDCGSAFVQRDAEHWLCDIYALARMVLHKHGVTSIYGGDCCTFTDSERFFSYRRDGDTGRMATLVWLN